MRAYERELNQDPERALRQGSMHFDEKSAVHDALRGIVQRLNELRIPFAIVGGMAMFHHGFRRFTDDVDILVTPEGLAAIHRELEGLGYVPPFSGSKQLRDVANGVRIEFLQSGQFPGDGKPKPVAFPNPTGEAIEVNGIPILNLPRLIELKLASGMTNAGRLKDLADVQELIRALQLPADFVTQLNPYVRPKFTELWNAIQAPESDDPHAP
jgi:hypothetical protein